MKNASVTQYIGTAVVTLIAVFATVGIQEIWVRLLVGLVIACVGAFVVEFFRRRAGRLTREDQPE